ncbi:hypothetical protein BDW02DRAFT_375582 [Decorospora gaudefroyi]|uniref:Uncharacterized protein n=1 Tax=Decorospora gaudefroyi TaxID=184978 RepID=A0A6A5KJC1_9PLEO|nr:hypothetical protein BDW02DRAFT_375582 [Decorospora gaudefroyi]
MSLAYKAEELLALRDSVSESAVSLDKFPDDDVIKEHVIRPSASASANLVSRSSNRSLRVPVAAALAPTGPQKRPSPTPSIKRGKAEKLLKEHGSPPGLRVTAGGRIVPSDLPPLGTSRYGDTTYRPQQPLRVAPGNIIPAQSQPNSNNTARIEVVGGQPVVIFGDRMFALPAVDTTNSTMPPSVPTAMASTAKQMPDPSLLASHGALPGFAFVPPRTSTHTPFAGMDLSTLKSQQALKKQELRTVEQTEVLQASHQSEAWRAGMIEKKRCLIVELDALRKQITAMENEGTTAQPSSFSGPMGTGPVPTASYVAPQFQQPIAPAIYPYATPNPYASMPWNQPQPQPPSFSGFPSFPAAEPAPFVPASTNLPHSPGSASRRSRAIEIKPPPPEETKKTSALNPKSPTYEPATKSSIMQGAMPPTPSPQKRSQWQVQEVPVPVKHEDRAPSRKHSLSSIDTMDFFPTNTHEHSSTRVAPQPNETKQSSTENTAVPSTPEKQWPASPWNEDHTDRLRNTEPAPKLTSWPEAFGKQPFIPSLRQGSAGQLLSASALGANMSSSTSSSNMPLRTNSDQRTCTDENWPFSGKAVPHVSSIYQEGYQAGYDHVGIPDSPEVLQGYIQGLLHFLTDESKKRQAEYQRGVNSRTPSLRGLVAGSLPHDSAIGMSFNRVSVNGSQENVRSAKGNPAQDVRRDLAYCPQGDAEDVPAQHMARNETIQDSHYRVTSGTQHVNPPVKFAQRNASGHRQAILASIEDDMSRGMQEKGIASRADPLSNGGGSQPFFGNQIQNRIHGTALNMHRFYPASKELSPSERGGYTAPTTRPFATHRLSGLDGAMDDLAEMINDSYIDDRRHSVAVESRSAEGAEMTEYEESNAFCFKASSSKDKQKATCSPPKATDMERDKAASSPANTNSSPKKPGEHSPAKAKLEQMTNKFRRGKKDDARTMSPDERMKRSDKWRQRFQQLKRTEMDEIEAHRANSRT